MLFIQQKWLENLPIPSQSQTASVEEGHKTISEPGTSYIDNISEQHRNFQVMNVVALIACSVSFLLQEMSL